MAKTTGPLFSLEAHGSIKHITYRGGRQGNNVSIKHGKKVNKSISQLCHQFLFCLAGAFWAAENLADWQAETAGQKITPFLAFQKDLIDNKIFAAATGADAGDGNALNCANGGGEGTPDGQVILGTESPYWAYLYRAGNYIAFPVNESKIWDRRGIIGAAFKTLGNSGEQPFFSIGTTNIFEYGSNGGTDGTLYVKDPDGNKHSTTLRAKAETVHTMIIKIYYLQHFLYIDGKLDSTWSAADSKYVNTNKINFGADTGSVNITPRYVKKLFGYNGTTTDEVIQKIDSCLRKN